MQPSLADQANDQMVDRMIAEGALWSPRLIAAFRATPRHRFLDRVFQFQRKSNRWREVITRDPGPEEIDLLYSDRALITHLDTPRRFGTDAEPPLPISSSSQPSLMAQMLEDLELRPGLRTLEIGAGTGYNAALLACVVAPAQVISLDVDRAVLAEAWDHLRAFPERRVELRHADGRQGCPEGGPFDRLMVTAATPDLEPAWLEQLAEGGLLLAPLALAPGLAYVVRGTMRPGVFQGRLTRAAYFMPLRAEKETGAPDVPVAFSGPMHSMPAPWAGWFDRRRPRLRWFGFIQALVFYGWLRGLEVHYRTASNGQALFGVSAPQPRGGSGRWVCWLGSQDWKVNGSPGRDLGWNLWRAFLNAGGPWPTEFHLQASWQGGLQPQRRESYLRQGPRCQQLWEMIEPRERLGWV
jgi:protein-L-isoaspartate(D-aspartate) O-methyltransferase